MKTLLTIGLMLALNFAASAGTYRVLVQDPGTGEFRFALVDLLATSGNEDIDDASWTFNLTATQFHLGETYYLNGSRMEIEPGSIWTYAGTPLNSSFYSLVDGELARFVNSGASLEWDGLSSVINSEQSSGDARHLFMLRNSEFGGNVFTGFSRSGASALKGIQESPHFSSPVIVAYREYPGDTQLTDAPGIVIWQKGLAPHFALEGYHQVEFFSTQFEPFRVTVDGQDWLDQPVNTGSSPTFKADNITFDGTPPASPSAPGEQGTLIQSGDYLYVCVAPNTWRRVALSSW
jgi:hypothetical protein